MPQIPMPQKNSPPLPPSFPKPNDNKMKKIQGLTQLPPSQTSVFDRLSDKKFYTGSQKIKAIENQEKAKIFKKGE